MRLDNKYFYETILDSFKSKKIYLKNLKKKIKYKKLNFIFTPKTNSMLDTIIKSQSSLKKFKNFFLTSCDCIGQFDALDLRKIISENDPDIVFFAFKFSNLQKNLINSHSLLSVYNKTVADIKVKHKYTNKFLVMQGIFDMIEKYLII